MFDGMLQCVALIRVSNIGHHVAVCCGVWHCVAVCCSVMHLHVCCMFTFTLQCVQVYCSVLYCFTVCCGAACSRGHSRSRRCTRERAAPQNSATQCVAAQWTHCTHVSVVHMRGHSLSTRCTRERAALQNSATQCVAAHCNTLHACECSVCAWPLAL